MNDEFQMTKSERSSNDEARSFELRPSTLIRHLSFVIRHSWFVAMCAVALSAFAQSDDRTSLAVEAVTRLQNVDLDQNTKLKDTVFKLLERTRGTPDFLRLVRHFKLKGQQVGLLDLAISQPADEAGVEAVRLVLAEDSQRLIEEKLAGESKAALALTQALGNSGSKEAVPLLLPIVRNEQADPALRREAIRGLAKTEQGATAIVQLARDHQLADDLKTTASLALGKARWENIRDEAARLLPLPPGQNNQPLPPLADLLRRKGNIENGRRVFNTATAACASCHKVKDQGTEVGPDLSEIGSKLAKEALYESIIDPSAGVSFGYEAHQIELKSGEEAYGLIVSETADELAIKNNTGVVTRYKKADIKSRQQMKLSIMPAGLVQAMSPDELVDLIEYLGSLKKK
jgi:putative heme-binding domain-containing protein